MINNPKFGWCNFKLGDFTGSPSYLTDVPVDLLMAFINYHSTGCGSAWFDEEGSEFTLVLNPYSVFIISEKEKPVLYHFPDLNVYDLEKELIDDLENELNTWSEFITGDDKEEIIQHRNEIRQKIALLKSYIKK